jgi:hypothetical protein
MLYLKEQSWNHLLQKHQGQLLRHHRQLKGYKKCWALKLLIQAYSLQRRRRRHLCLYLLQPYHRHRLQQAGNQV